MGKLHPCAYSAAHRQCRQCAGFLPELADGTRHRGVRGHVDIEKGAPFAEAGVVDDEVDGQCFVGDPRDQTTVERLDSYNGEHGIWDCTRCYFCNQRCPKGVDPRDAIAKLGAEAFREASKACAAHGQPCDASRASAAAGESAGAPAGMRGGAGGEGAGEKV